MGIFRLRCEAEDEYVGGKNDVCDRDSSLGCFWVGVGIGGRGRDTQTALAMIDVKLLVLVMGMGGY